MRLGIHQYAQFDCEIGNKSRTELRESLYQRYKKDSLLDLSAFPKTTDPYISISHTKDCSGWVSASDPIGFDIESSDRAIQEATLLRVSSEEELKKAPNPVALWVAKEAAFKSLWRSDTTTLISQIEVHEWQPLSHFIYSFKFCNSNNLDVFHNGWVETQDRFTLGIAIPTP